MPSCLQRFQQSGQSHFLTFSCYRRQANFNSAETYDRHYALREVGIVEIESAWTARDREAKTCD
jgi:hypothetical protein